MNTQTLQVFSLRGMDERWIVDPVDALFIQDMTWTSNDSWRTSGGYEQVFLPSQPEAPDQSYDRNTEPSSSSAPEDEREDVYSRINSIHWFAQHNGARQWLIYEEQNFIVDEVTGEFVPDVTSSLKAFDGSLFKPNAVGAPEFIKDSPSRTLIQYESKDSALNTTTLDNRSEMKLSSRTQSQSYGGRIYFVNGFDEPVVFDGSFCERAGFQSTPPPPTAQSGSHLNGCTFPFALGDYGQPQPEFNDATNFSVTFENVLLSVPPRSRGFYSLSYDVPYWGLGSRSDATIGASGYRFKGNGVLPYDDSNFVNSVQMKTSYYGAEQVDTRLCGFQYKVTYVNERGQESEPSSPSSIVSVENGRGGQKKCLHGKGLISLDVPIGPKECVARRVYRTRNVYDSKGDLYTTGGQRSFYLLKEVPDNMTTKIVDGHPDTSLGELLDESQLGNFPSRTKFLAVFKNTMFAAGADLNELQYSAPLFPEVFPVNNRLVIGDDDGGPITGMRATKNALVVFKTRGIYLVKGDPSTGFAAQTLNKDIGCVAPNSITELPGLGLAFLSEKSVFLLEGALENTGSVTGVVNIGAEIPNQLQLLNQSAAVRSSSALYLRDKEYWLAIPTLGSADNDLCLIYHYEVGSWSVRKDFPIDCMVASKDHRGYLFMGSYRNTDPTNAGILVYSRGFQTKGGTQINSIYETVSNDYQSVFTNFRPAHVLAYAVGYGDNGLNVNTRVNRSIDQVRTTVQTAEQQDPNEVYPVYGSAKFDSDRWIAYRPTVVRFDISTTQKGPVRELSVSFASADGNKIEIIGYDLEAKVGEQRSIKPLNKALRASGR